MVSSKSKWVLVCIGKFYISISLFFFSRSRKLDRRYYRWTLDTYMGFKPVSWCLRRDLADFLSKVLFVVKLINHYIFQLWINPLDCKRKHYWKNCKWSVKQMLYRLTWVITFSSEIWFCFLQTLNSTSCASFRWHHHMGTIFIKRRIQHMVSLHSQLMRLETTWHVFGLIIILEVVE